MTVHKVKSWKYLFESVRIGLKLHDFRDMTERDYKVGDLLVLQEYDQTNGTYTGREIECLITYITDHRTPCAMSSTVLDRDYGVLSIKVVKNCV